MAFIVLGSSQMNDTSTPISNGSRMLPLLTVDDVRRRLNVSRGFVHDHANGRRRPLLSSIKLGKVRRFDPAAVEDFIEQCRRIAQAA